MEKKENKRGIMKTKLKETKGLVTHETRFSFSSLEPMLQANKSLAVIFRFSER